MAEDFPFVLPWDDASPGVSNVAAWNERPAGKHGPLRVKDGHLYAGQDRIRFFGVNLCFGANFPQHADAEKLAARMARFGINCVRFHHMDTGPAPGGIFKPDMRKLDAAQLDKLDFLIAKLKENGIYVDLNLHVSRTYPGLPRREEGVPTFAKGADNFAPGLIELQREYARDLLTHRNPYTGTTYAEEPAVALVEINNENALLSEWWNGGLDRLPASLADELARQWNAWLDGRYADAAALRKGWGVREEPLGAERLNNGGFARGLALWSLEQHQGAKAQAAGVAEGPAGGRALRIEVQELGAEGWHVQLSQSGLAFEKGRPCTLSFQAKADAPRRITVSAMQAHEPWKGLWSAEARLTKDWQAFRYVIAPSEDEAAGRITFSQLGAAKGVVWLADVSLKSGGVLGLRAGETRGSVAFFRKQDFAGRTLQAQRDWVRFLWETEERYWTGMHKFIRKDLGARALVIGTQMGYSPFPIQAQLDVVDVHSYWQHPHFPNRPWDREDWTVRNISMAGAPDGGTITGLALRRVAGKPYVCTEYNHSAPNTYSSEAFLLLAAYAALQDWDGIFAFAYCHRRDEWDTRRFTGFFDIDQHAAKMATLPAAAAIFRRADVAAPAQPAVALLSLEQALEKVRLSGPGLRADAFGLDRLDALRRPVALGLADAHAQAPSLRAAPRGGEGEAIAGVTGELTWDARSRRVLVNSPRSKAVIGAMKEGERFGLGEITFTAGRTRQGWAALTMTAMEGRDFSSPGRWLVTATGYIENAGMAWKNPERSSVGAAWGTGPCVVEGVPFAISFGRAADRLSAWALDGRGRRQTKLSVKEAGGRAVLEPGPEHKTLWYEIEAR